jgi:hypothetical protein
MAWKRGKGVGFVIVRTRPNEPAQVLGPGSASAGGEIRIFADEGTADRDARRLQEELRDPGFNLPNSSCARSPIFLCNLKRSSLRGHPGAQNRTANRVRDPLSGKGVLDPHLYLQRAIPYRCRLCH